MNKTKWETRLVGDICQIIAGGTPSRQEQKYYGGNIPWVKIGDMLQNPILETEECITEEGLKNSSAKLLPKGTILISIFATIGRTSVLGIDATTNQAIVGLILNKKDLIPSYLKYYLDHSINTLVQQSRGVAQNNINSKILKNLQLPIPPISIQGEIVAILDQADAIRKRRQQAIEELNNLIPATFYDMFGDPVSNSKDWKTVKLGNVTKINCPMVDPKEERYQDLLHIAPNNISKVTGEILPVNTAREDGLISGKFLFDEKCVLYSKIRPYLRKSALPDFVGLCSADMYPIHPSEDKMTREFLWTLLLSEAFLLYTQSLPSRASIPKLNRTELSNYDTILPPFSLQEAFSEKVKGILKLKAKYEHCTKEGEDLFNSLVQRAFKGEL